MFFGDTGIAGRNLKRVPKLGELRLALAIPK
jgi:hypothetical protein